MRMIRDVADSYGELMNYNKTWFVKQLVDPTRDRESRVNEPNELEHEETIYQYFEKLQRSVILKLKIAGVSNGLEAVLATDFRGHDISQERLEDLNKEKIKKALSAFSLSRST
ncbi:hypothetical protein EC991_010644 [Linnemannia zychae]|nr:hypothetical protein EC991_010644 [Linnemannia zychae]